MKSLLRKSIGLGAVLTLLAGPALAQPYYAGPPGYYAPHHEIYREHEHQMAMWRAHERHEAWWHAAHGYGYHQDGRDY